MPVDNTLSLQLEQYFATCPYPVRLAYLFGSTARGQATFLSDVDVAVYLEQPDAEQRARLYLNLRHDLQQAIDRQDLDLVYLNDASPLLAYQIIGGQLLACTSDAQRTTLEAGVVRAYFDERSAERIRHRLLRARILEGKMGARSAEMIEERVVLDRLTYIDAALARLQSRRGMTLDEFLADPDQRDAAFYQLQTCIEAVMDIANHLVAALGLGRPRDRKDLFTLLTQADILERALAARLAAAASLRNVLVHSYIDVAPLLVHQAIQNDLGDIEAFSRSVVLFLERKEKR